MEYDTYYVRGEFLFVSKYVRWFYRNVTVQTKKTSVLLSNISMRIFFTCFHSTVSKGFKINSTYVRSTPRKSEFSDNTYGTVR